MVTFAGVEHTRGLSSQRIQEVCSESDDDPPPRAHTQTELREAAVANFHAILESSLADAEREEDLKQILWLLDVPSAALLSKLTTFA